MISVFTRKGCCLGSEGGISKFQQIAIPAPNSNSEYLVFETDKFDKIKQLGERVLKIDFYTIVYTKNGFRNKGDNDSPD